MKKALLTTALLVATTGMAAAEVTLNGYGRFGLVYLDDGTDSDTQLATRMRININGSLETDSGITFGGRIRLQHTNGDANSVWVDANGDGIVDAGETGVTGGGARLSAAKLFVESGGLRVEVGNTDGAFDNAGLMYNSEIGFTDSSLGESRGNFFGFSSGPYAFEEIDRMGIYASYSMGDFTARISLIDPDQTDDGDEEEVSISFDYSTGPFSVSLAAAQDGGGVADNDLFFAGVAYKIGESTNVGLNYHDDGDAVGETLTLYGNHTLASGLTLAGYITSVDDAGGDSETGGGIGASYSLGEGARVSGAIHKLDDVTYADLGVRFDF
jgi:outer membrane protein OmpU